MFCFSKFECTYQRCHSEQEVAWDVSSPCPPEHPSNEGPQSMSLCQSDLWKACQGNVPPPSVPLLLLRDSIVEAETGSPGVVVLAPGLDLVPDPSDP